MTYPPLKDPDFHAADPPPGPEDHASRSDRISEGEPASAERPAEAPAVAVPVLTPEPAVADNADARASVVRADDGAGDHETTAKLDELDDDDLEELLEQVDLGDLDAIDTLRAPLDTGSRPLPDTIVPVSLKTDEAKAAGEIPMLTEVVQVPRYDSEDLPHSFAEVDWGDLSERVRENVLERLLRRSDVLLDTQLQSTLSAVLERALDNISHELHDALTRLIRDIVARAVTEELTRLHAEIAKRNRSDRPT